jgi:hypothetical protein
MNTHPGRNTPSRRSLSEKLQQARADVAKWNQIAALPGLSPAAAQFARNIARSSKAAVVLFEKALAFQMQTREALHRKSVPPKE